MNNMSEEDRDRLTGVEVGLKSHLITCVSSNKRNERDHNQMKLGILGIYAAIGGVTYMLAEFVLSNIQIINSSGVS